MPPQPAASPPPCPYDPFTCLHDTLINIAEREETRRANLTSAQLPAADRVCNA